MSDTRTITVEVDGSTTKYLDPELWYITDDGLLCVKLDTETIYHPVDRIVEIREDPVEYAAVNEEYDLNTLVKHIIEKYGEEDGIAETRLFWELANESDASWAEIDAYIDRLCRKGELYVPTEGHYKAV